MARPLSSGKFIPQLLALISETRQTMLTPFQPQPTTVLQHHLAHQPSILNLPAYVLRHHVVNLGCITIHRLLKRLNTRLRLRHQLQLSGSNQRAAPAFSADCHSHKEWRPCWWPTCRKFELRLFHPNRPQAQQVEHKRGCHCGRCGRRRGRNRIDWCRCWVSDLQEEEGAGGAYAGSKHLQPKLP